MGDEMERLVWAAAFAAEWAAERDRYASSGRGSINDIDGLVCAEVAELALRDYLDAISGPDRGCLPLLAKAKGGA